MSRRGRVFRRSQVDPSAVKVRVSAREKFLPEPAKAASDEAPEIARPPTPVPPAERPQQRALGHFIRRTYCDGSVVS